MAQDRPLFMSPTRPGFQSRFLLPQHWGIWIGLGLLWLLCWLPWRVQLGLGRQIGHLGWTLAGKRRRDTLTNLALCFPELDETERVRMGREVFVQASIGLFESLRAWWRPDTLKKNLTISGVHHVIERLRAGQGVLVLGGHYTLLDLGGLLNVHHSGGSNGWRSIYSIFPETGTGICMLMNAEGANELWQPVVFRWNQQQSQG